MAPVASDSRVRILAVDDRPENLLALQAALDRPDYELVCVESGERALEEVRRHEFALILLDVQMPTMDGFETARRIRESTPARDTPILFVTAIFRSEAYVRRGYDLGAVDYLFKPLNIDILQAKVGVFCDLYLKSREMERQAELLRQSSLREQENAFLREAVRSRDEFLSIAAHELRTPITPLALNLQTFQELAEKNRFGEVEPAKLSRMLRTAVSQVERLGRLVDDLLDVSRIAEGRLRLEPSATDLAEIVERVLESFEDQIRHSPSEVRLELERGVVGEWDRARVEQVVINLLTNALKYGGGKPISLRAKREGDHAVFEVEDRGIGVATEDRERIFQKFDRAVSPDHYGGLGLGLYIAREIVSLHRGEIAIDCPEDGGSRFTVRLPIEAV
jgi:signal transduction histidine kinase